VFDDSTELAEVRLKPVVVTAYFNVFMRNVFRRVIFSPSTARLPLKLMFPDFWSGPGRYTPILMNSAGSGILTDRRDK